MKKAIYLTSFLAYSFLSLAQKDQAQPMIENLDSLKQVLPENNSFEEKTQTLIYIGYHHWWNYFFYFAIAYARMALSTAKKTKNDSLLIRPLNLLSSSYSYNLEDSLFLESNLKLLTLALKYDASDSYMEALNDRGSYFIKSKHQDSCLFYYKTLENYSKNHPNNTFRAVTLCNLGLLCQRLKLEDRAFNYFKQAYEASKKIDDLYTMFYISSALHNIYKSKNQPDSAKFFLREAEFVKDSNLFPSVDFDYLLLRFRSSYEDGLFQKCDSILLEMAQIKITANHVFQQNQYENCMIQSLYAKGKYREALDRISQNEKTSPNFYRTVSIVDIHKIKADSYRELSDYENAYYNSVKIKELTDSINAPINKAKILTLQMESEIERELDILKEYNTNSELELEKKNLQIVVALLGILILITLLIIAYFSFTIKSNLAKKLEQTVKNRTKEINESNESLKQKINELSAFNRITSHDLKQPIRTISSFSNLLLENTSLELPQKEQKHLKFIYECTDQLNHILNSLEHFNAIDSESTGKEHYKVFNLQDAVQKVVSSFQAEENTQITIDPSVNTDIKSVQEIIFSIIKIMIENGLKYNTSELKEIYVNYTHKENTHIISIKDNGIGIKPDYHERIFQMFERLHSKTEYSGTGLGLSICMKLIKKLRGEITLESNVSEGSTFFISLPE